MGEPVISHVEKIGEIAGDQEGAKRILNQEFHETLKSVDEENYTFSYSIDDGPGPVAIESVKNYLGTVSLYSITDTNQTFVVWTSSFESNFETEVSEFCNPIYSGLLKALKDRFT